MPYPFQDSFSCPSCGEPITIPLGETRETYLCQFCEKIIHVVIWAEDSNNDPAPIDRRYIC